MSLSLRAVGIVSLFALVSAVAACESDSTSPEPTPPPNGGVDLPPTPVEPACPAPTKGPTLHKGDVAANEVWSADASPHIIEQNVSVRSGNVLTIEPCAEIRVAKDKHLQIAFPGTPNQGTLIAEGTAQKPIKIVGQDGARWGSVMVHAPGTARLAYVTIEDGGAEEFDHGASLMVTGDGVDGADPLVYLDHVTIKKSRGTGAWFERGATFIEGSRDLTITASGNENFPYPIEIEEHAVDRLPTGSYTGNAKDEILLDPAGGQFGGTGFLADATIHDRGVPYQVGRSKGDSLLIGGRTDKALVTVTIEPGVKLKFQSAAAFKIQHFTNTAPSTASLIARGTAEKPIVFTSAAAAPAPGDWQGLWYGGVPAATNALDNVRIEFAGGDCGCILNTCSSITQHEGAVIFTAEPPSAFITNTTFANIPAHAITEGYDGAFVDFKETNKFEGVSGCKQTMPRTSTTTCPTPKPACDE